MMVRIVLSFLLPAMIFASCEVASKHTEEDDRGPESSSPAKFSYRMLNATIDSVQYNHPYELDLNNDQKIDFFLTSLLVEENDEPYLYLLANRQSSALNKFLVRPAPELIVNGFWAVPLEKGFEIGENAVGNMQWNPDLSKAHLINVTENESGKSFGGEWIGKKDRYLGLKFKIGQAYHYGWLRISHAEGEAKLAVLDYAYNKEAGKPIFAGQK